VRLFRIYAGLVFSFAWVPVMYLAFTVDRGFDTSQYMRLWAAYYLAMVLAELPWGWVADRFGSRPLLISGPLVLAAGFAVLGHAASYPVCLVAMAVTGAAHAMISGADSAFLYEVVLSEGRRNAALHEEAVAHRWRLFGVSGADLAGGFIAFLLGTSAAFDLSIVLMLAAACVAWRLPTGVGRSRSLNGPRWTSVFRQLARPDILWVVGWYTTVFVFLRLGFQLYQPTLLAAGLSDPRWPGGVLCLLNLVAGVSAIYVSGIHRRLAERGTAWLVVLLMAVSFVGLSFGSVVLLAPLLCLQQVSFGLMQPVGRTALNHRIDGAERASMLSAQSVLARLAFGLILLMLSGGRWDQPPEDSLGPLYLVLAGAALVAGVFWWWLHPAWTRAGDAPDP
jgi:MFS family permease